MGSYITQKKINEPDKYLCEICGEKFRLKNSLTLHLNKVHRITFKKHKNYREMNIGPRP
jgi:uncharacterized C2H2 Zn-finger protein